MAKQTDGPLEEPVSNQVKTVGGRGPGRPPNNPTTLPASRETSGVPEANSTQNPLPTGEAEAPLAQTIYHPNVLAVGAAGTNSGVPIPPLATPNPGTTTQNYMGSNIDQTAPPFNPAPNHPQAQRTYTEDEVRQLLAQRAANPSLLPEPTRVSERLITVKPTKSFHPYIGDRTWYLEKDVSVRVPQSVAEVLMRSGSIYPVFNT